jgi:pyruvate/2-oxoglutarate dehydrogenase complex dihydrolipoamide dehydrogenase (E3) component
VPDSVSLECDALLIATGRTPNVEDLGLDAAGIVHTPGKGVKVDSFLATSNSNVYGVGDCVAGAPRLTHASGEMAKVAVQNSLFEGQWELNYDHVPKCTYTEPEMATVGLDGTSAAAAGDSARPIRTLFTEEMGLVPQPQLKAPYWGKERLWCNGVSPTLSIGGALPQPPREWTCA